MDVELEPAQPPEVVRAIDELLRENDPQPDPWWQFGVDEALGDGEAA